MKKLISALTLIAIIISLTACGGDDKVSDTSQQTSEPTSESLVTSAPETTGGTEVIPDSSDGMAYEALIASLPFYACRSISASIDSFKITHNRTPIIDGTFKEKHIYYEKDSSGKLYDIYMLLCGSADYTTYAFIINYDTEKNDYTCKLKYSLTDCIIYGDGTASAKVATDGDGTLNGNTDAYILLDKRFEPVFDTSSLPKNTSLPFIGHGDISVTQNDDGTYGVAVGNRLSFTPDVFDRTPFQRIDNEGGCIDIYSGKGCVLSRAPRIVGTTLDALDMKEPNYTSCPDGGDEYMYYSLTDGLDIAVRSIDGVMYYGIRHKGKITTEVKYTDILYDKYPRSTAEPSVGYYIVLFGDDGCTLVLVEGNKLRQRTFDEGKQLGNRLVVRSEGKWGEIDLITMKLIRDIVCDEVSIYTTQVPMYANVHGGMYHCENAVFKYTDASGNAYYQIDDIDEKYKYVNLQDGYRYFVETLDGEKYYMTCDGSEIAYK